MSNGHDPVWVENKKGGNFNAAVGCSCGWRSPSAPTRHSTMANGWKAHCRKIGVEWWGNTEPTRFAEGPAAGFTYDEWNAAHPDVNPYAFGKEKKSS